MLVKTISQVTAPSRTFAIVPATLTGNHKPKHNYSLTGTQSALEQNLFIVPFLTIFSKNLLVHLLCTVIKTNPKDVILPKHLAHMQNDPTQSHL